MRAAVHHLRTRVREAATSPRLLLFGVTAGVVLALFDVAATRIDRSPAVRFLMQAYALWVAATLASMIGPGASSTPGQDRFWSTRFVGISTSDWACSALPIGTRTRLLVESLVGVAVILVWRASFEPARVLLRDGGVPADPAALLATLGLDACLLLPAAAACTAPTRARAPHVLRAIAVPLYVLGVISWADERLGAWTWPVLSMVFTVMVVGNSPPRDGTTWAWRWPTRSARPLARLSRPPEVQVWRDVWLGPLTNNPWATVAFVALGAGASAAAHLVRRDADSAASFTAGLILGMSVYFLQLPLGVPLLGRQSKRGGTPLFGGWYVASWAALPVRREVLIRGVYAHGLIWGAFLLVMCFVLAPAAMQARWLVAPVGCAAVVLAAGALVCVAVGDRARGVAALAALGCALGAGPLLSALITSTPTAYAVPSAVVAVAAALAGGLPPLTHLNHSRRQRGISAGDAGD